MRTFVVNLIELHACDTIFTVKAKNRKEALKKVERAVDPFLTGIGQKEPNCVVEHLVTGSLKPTVKFPRKRLSALLTDRSRHPSRLILACQK